MRFPSILAAATLLAGAAQAAPLTFGQALALADQTAPSLAARSADIDAARAQAVAAGRLPDPRLRLGLDNFPISGPPAGSFSEESMTMATVGVMQDVPSGAKRSADRRRAAADVSAAEAARRLEARRVRLGAALAWIDLYYAERRLAALDEVAGVLSPMRDAAQAELTSGARRPAQALEPEQLSARLADRQAELTAAVARARAELARWTGDPDAEVAGRPPAYAIDPVTLRAGLDDHPSLAAYDGLIEQADADAALARADKRPDWSWELAYQRRDPMWGDMVSAEVTVRLPLFAASRQTPVIQARDRSAAGARLSREAARRELLAALNADLADHVMHHDRMIRARDTLLPLARRGADLETTSYSAGSASFADVLEALLALVEARIDVLDREAEVERDGVRINLTYGVDPQ